LKPTTFQCSMLIPISANDICTAIVDVDRWSEFGGYGILPGIKSAVFESQTADVVGSRIRVRNTDGSQHVEEIYKWIPGQEVAMKFHEFTPPLSNLATHFTEEWHLKVVGNATHVTRSFEMYPRRLTTRPLLWLISLLFRRAIAQHLEQMSGEKLW
jgi:hypothetical protein